MAGKDNKKADAGTRRKTPRKPAAAPKPKTSKDKSAAAPPPAPPAPKPASPKGTKAPKRAPDPAAAPSAAAAAGDRPAAPSPTPEPATELPTEPTPIPVPSAPGAGISALDILSQAKPQAAPDPAQGRGPQARTLPVAPKAPPPPSPAPAKPRAPAKRQRQPAAVEAAPDKDKKGVPSLFSKRDIEEFSEGELVRAYERFGAHPTTVDGTDGVTFAVWAPNASRVAVIGDFNDWDGSRHPMRRVGDAGIWELFVPGAKDGHLYKFEIASDSGAHVTQRADPYAFAGERAPGTASVVTAPGRHRWTDGKWMKGRDARHAPDAPLSFYEVHLGSWRRKPEEGHRLLTYRELADDLVDYVVDMGFTHIQLMPVAEHPYDGSLGFHATALFAPTSRYGKPDDFRAFVDRCHKQGLGVVLDWVPGYFPNEANGLGGFDGTALYEHPDPNRGRAKDGYSLFYDHGRPEVAGFLASNALYWLDRFHIDGLRMNDLARMLYLDYDRGPGEWTPNLHGGNENLEAIGFLRRLNDLIAAEQKGAFTIAEETSAWPMVSHPTHLGGLGFGYKWAVGWVWDTLRYMARNPVHRKYYQDEMTNWLLHAFDENFVLPLTHDHMSIGRGSLFSRMPGDRWQRFANLRTYYALLYTQPGKKLLFMGSEFAQDREWNSDISLDWHLLGDPLHAGVQNLVRDLNHLYTGTTALHQGDCDPGGFSWIDYHDADQSVIAYMRHGKDPSDFAVVVCNFTPVVREGYRIGVPEDGLYMEKLNTDAESYGGGNVGNFGGVRADAESSHDRPYSLSLRLPPFAAVVLQRVEE